MKFQAIALSSLVISVASIGISLWTIIESKQIRSDNTAREISQVAEFSMKQLASKGLLVSSVRVSGAPEFGYKCSAYYARGGTTGGDGSNPTAACLSMLDHPTK